MVKSAFLNSSIYKVNWLVFFFFNYISGIASLPFLSIVFGGLAFDRVLL